MKKTFSILLSIVVLLSSLNFNLSVHYCGEAIVDVALLGDAEACSMAADISIDSKKKSCCSDRLIVIEGEDHLSSKSIEKGGIERIDLLTAELNYPIDLLVQKTIASSYYENYSPPLIEQEIFLSVQSFLL